MNGLSKSHRIAASVWGLMVPVQIWAIERAISKGLDMLSNMRLCSNVLAQQVVQTSFGRLPSQWTNSLLPGGRERRATELIYKAINDIPGLSNKPKAGLISPLRLIVKCTGVVRAVCLGI